MKWWRSTLRGHVITSWMHLIWGCVYSGVKKFLPPSWFPFLYICHTYNTGFRFRGQLFSHMEPSSHICNVYKCVGCVHTDSFPAQVCLSCTICLLCAVLLSSCLTYLNICNAVSSHSLCSISWIPKHIINNIKTSFL